MKKLKPFKTTDAAVFYKVAKPANVTRELVGSVDWPETLRMLCFDFKPVKLNPARLPDFKLPAKYSVSLACYSPAGGVKSSPAPASGIETREPKNFAEFKKVSRKDEKDFLKRFWQKTFARSERRLQPYEFREPAQNKDADRFQKWQAGRALRAYAE